MLTASPAPPTAPTYTLRDVGKYTLHGLAFAALFLIVSFAWAGIFLVLVVCGLFIGLAIGIVLYFVFMGYVNSIVTETLWFNVRTGFVTCLGHGFLLFLALLPLNLLYLGLQAFVTQDLLVLVLIYLATTPIAGVIAKAVAGLWEVRPPPWPTEAPPPAEEAPPDLSALTFARK